MRYFRILGDDVRYADRWFLDEPRAGDASEIDARKFTNARRYTGPPPATVPIDQPGRKVQFLLAAFDMPVVTERLAKLLDKHAPGEIEWFPVTIGNGLTGYVILNALCREACVDERKTEILWWKPEDGRPDKVGKFRMISNLAIDPARTHERHIFRLVDWEIALIVSDKIKTVLEKLPELGIVFIGRH